MLGPHGGRGGQKRPKNGPHGLCMTPNGEKKIAHLAFAKFAFQSWPWQWPWNNDTSPIST